MSSYHQSTPRAEMRATGFLTALKYPERFLTMFHAHSSVAAKAVEVGLKAVLTAIAAWQDKGAMFFPLRR
jgi:hypothetical protein